MPSAGIAEYLPNVGYLISAAILLALPTLYYMALPRVIPGVPFHESSSRSIKGDIPAFVEHTTRTSETFTFFTRQCEILKAPLVQVFLLPFSKYPMLVLSDHREIEDILTRRTREFDRSSYTTLLFESLIPHATISMASHKMFKSQRSAWAPTMSPGFINHVAAAHMHKTVLELIALWQRKAVLAEGRPFRADDDIRYMTLDAIWAIALGDRLRCVETRGVSLTGQDVVKRMDIPAEHVVFPNVDVAPICRAIENLLDCVGPISKSPFPSLYQLIMRRKKWYRRDWAVKESTMTNLIQNCRQAFDENTDPDTSATSAMELVLKREHAQLLKSGRKSDPEDRGTKDELFTFLLAVSVAQKLIKS